jgi:hypothetical protein
MKKFIILLALVTTACATKKHKPCPAYGKVNAEKATEELRSEIWS